MRRILLIGKNGQVGWELVRTLASLGQVIALDREGMDLCNLDSIRRVVRKTSPNLIVNAAAYTAVDKAESEPEIAMAVNGLAPGLLAEEAKRLHATLIHFSTDYVFDGRKSEPYSENDAPNPINVYGKTKLEGERAVMAIAGTYLIFRVSWVYGTRGKNFLLTMLRLARERDELRIVADQVGAPTWSRLIAEVVAQVMCVHLHSAGKLSELSGIYHLSAKGNASWYEFTNEIFGNGVVRNMQTTLGLPQGGPRISPISSDDYPSAAARPANSLLNSSKVVQTFGILLPDWRASLALCLEGLVT